MAIIAQKLLFSYKNFGFFSDLERLEFLLKHLPDEKLMRTLEKHRGNGRNDYPVRAMWNSLLAGLVYKHSSITSLREELMRNASLLEVCGFEVFKGVDAVPSADAYTNFFANLIKFQDEVGKIFYELVKLVSENLDGFGKNLAIDSKVIPSRANRQTDKAPDGRRDTDAGWAVKTYTHTDKSGKKYTKTKSIFGYKVHLMVDADYELPVERKVTPGNVADITAAKELLIDNPSPRLEALFDKAENLMADKGYDFGGFKLGLWRKQDIKAVIDTRHLTKEKLKPVEGHDHVFYDQDGKVYCSSILTRQKRQMFCAGFEKDRESLKFRCPARHCGTECECMRQCPIASQIRIKLESDPRVFMAVSKDSYKWQRLYKKRTSVERVNSRFDVSLGFEDHYIRGLGKMSVMVDLSLIAMLGTAHGCIKEGKQEHMRSFIKAAS
jgi:hypothetical protein